MTLVGRSAHSLPSRILAPFIDLGWRKQVLLGGVAVFTVILSWVTVLRYLTFHTYAWDLGVYNQALYTTIFDSRFLYYTTDLPAGTGGALFATHFSPVLLLLLPAYAVDPGPPTILVLQALALGGAAIPLYYLCEETTRSTDVSLCLALGYLVGPLAAGVSWYDFHPEAFIPLTGFVFLFYFRRLNLVGSVVSLLAFLGTVETIAPFVMLFLIIALVSNLVGSKLRRSRNLSLANRTALVCLAVTGLWFLLSYLVVTHLAPDGGTFGPGYAENWSILGAKSIYSVLPTAFLHPASAWQALHYNSIDKTWYVFILLFSTGFLFLFSDPEYYLPVFSWLGLALLSNSAGYPTITDQYPAYAIPFLFGGAVTGAAFILELDPVNRILRKLKRRPRELGSINVNASQPLRKRLRTTPSAAWMAGGTAILCSVVAAGIASPLLPAPIDGYPALTFGVPTTTIYDDALHQVLNLIPSSEGVLTTNAIFPEVSSRWDAYVLPASSFFLGNTTFQSAVDRYVNESDFILVDFKIDFTGGATLLYFANTSAFGVRAELLGAELFERGWTAPPTLWSPFSTTAPGAMMTTVYSRADPDLSTSFGSALEAGPGLAFGNQIWTGPYYYELPPGKYVATAWIRVVAHSQGTQLRVDITGHPIVVSTAIANPSAKGHDYTISITIGPSRTLESGYVVNQNDSPNTFDVNVTLEYNWSSGLVFDCAGWVYSSTATFYLYDLSLRQITA